MKRLVLSIAGACLLALLHLIAADGIWINPGGGLWSAGANWSGGNVAAGVDATANFSTVNLTGNTTVTLDTARTIGHLIFGDTAPSHNWILSGANTLTLDVSSGVPLINVVNQTATISSVIAGNDGFQKIGTGALVLTATNTVSGPVTFSGGTTTLNTSTGKLNGATSINIESGAKLVLDNSGAASAAQDLTDRLPSGVQLNMKGGEYSFLGANIFNNGASFQTVTLALNMGQSIISLDATANQSALLFTNGVLTRTTGATALFRGDNLGAPAAANVSQIRTSLNSNVPTLSNAGSGTSIGIVPYLIGDATSPSGNGTDFVTYIQGGVNGSPSTDGYKPLSASNYSAAFANSVNVKLSAAANTDTRTVLSLALTNAGTGTVASINSGHVLTIGNDAILSTGSVANTINGGSLTFGLNGVTSYEGIFHVVTGLTVGSAIVNNGANAVKLIKSSGGTLALSGTNTYSGGTWINAGTLQVSSDANLGGAAGAITITGGALNTLGSFATSRGITLNPGTNTFNIGVGTTLTANGAISGTGGLTMATGTGTLVLGGTNTFSGGISANSGTLSASSASNLGAASNTVTMGGGIFNATASFNAAVAFALSTPTTFNIASGVTFGAQGVVSGTGGLTLATGTGTLALSGANTYTGGTFLNAGTLAINSDGALGAVPGAAATNLTFGGNATLQLTSGAGTVALNANRNISLGSTFSGSFDANGASNTLTLGGVITGAGNFIKTGLGTVGLGVLNNYTGTTTVSQGTLSVADVTVAATVSSLGNATSAVVLGGASTSGTLLYTGANDTMTRGITVNAGGGTLSVSNAATAVAVSGQVIGTSNGTFTKDGAGTVTLSNATNNFTSAAVNAGTLKGGVTNGFGNLAAFTVNSGATLDMGNFGQTIGSLAGAGNVVISSGVIFTTGGNNGSTIFTGNMSGGGVLTKNGSGTMTLSGTNSYTAGTLLNAGSLKAGNNSSFAPGSVITIAGGATLDLNGFNESVEFIQSNVANSAVTLGSGTLTLLNVGGNGAVYAGSITGTGGLTVNGIGTLPLSGTANTYSGTTTVGTTGSFGGLKANAVNALSASSAHVINSGANLLLNGNNNTIGSLAGSGTVYLGNGTLTSGGDNSTTIFGGVISLNATTSGTPGNGGLTKVGTGTMTLSGTNTYTGATTINGGTLSVASNSNLGTGSLALGGGALNTTANMVLSRTVTLNSGTNTFNIASGTTLELSSTVNGAGGLTLDTGTGTLLLTGTKSFAGGVSINSGVLRASADDNLGLASGPMVFGGGTLNSTATFSSNRPITLNAILSAFDVNNLTTLTEQGAIGGTGGFVKQGLGTLILSGMNNYSGVTTVSSGILQAGSSSAFGSNSALTVTSTLDLNSNNISVGSLAGGGAVTLGSGTLTAGADNSSTSFSGSIGGSGGFVKSGTGTLTFSGTNNYGGRTTVNGGKLVVGADSNFGAGSLSIGSGATFATTGSFATSRGVTLSGGQDTIEVVGGATILTLSGMIGGSGDLFKAGLGTLSLANANNFAGSTTIGAGTLALAAGGSIISDQVTVNSSGIFDVTVGGYTVSTGKSLRNDGTVNGSINLTGGTMSGSGTLNGGLTVGSNGFISPGDSPGTMNTGATSYGSGGSYTWELNKADGTKGGDPGYDWHNITGTLTIGATSGSKFNVNVTGLNQSNAPGAVTNFVNSQFSSWTIASASTGITSTGTFANKINVDSSAFTNNNSLGGSNGIFAITKGVSNNASGAADMVVRYIPGVSTSNLGHVAADNAAQSAYSGGFSGNGGFGFGAWSLTTPGSPTFSGAFIGSSENNGTVPSGNIDFNSQSWALYAHTNNTAEAARSITNNLAIGQTLALDMDNGDLRTGPNQTVGFSLRNSSGQNVFEFFGTGGNTSGSDGAFAYSVAGGTTQFTNLKTASDFSADGLHTEFTMTDATHYSFTISGAGLTAQTFTGTLQSPAGGTTISTLRLFNFNPNSSGGNTVDAYFNNAFVLLPTFNGQAGATGNWGTLGNWAAHSPVNGGSLAFDGGTGSITANNDNLTSVYNIAFNGTSAPRTNATTYTLTGNNLTINGGIDNNSTNLQTLNNNLTLGASQSFNATSGGLTFAGTQALAGMALTVNAANPVTFGSGAVISGNGDMIKTGAGTLTLNAANTFTGDNTTTRGQVFITNGTVRVGHSTALGTQAGGTSVDLGDSNPIGGSITHHANNVALLADSGLSIANQIYVDTNTSGTTRTIGSDGTTGGVTFSGNVLLTGSAILTAAAGGDVTFSGTLGTPSFTTGGLTKAGAGTVTLTNANGYTGGTTIDAGTLVAGNNSAFGSTGTQTVTFNGGKLASNNDARSLSNNLIVNNVAGNQITGNSVTLAGAASGAGTLEVAVSAGKSVTVNSGAANGFAPAAIKVTTGTLLLGGDNKLGNATNLELAGGTFATAGFSEGSAGADGLGALTLSATSTLDFGAGASVVRFAGIAQSVADTILMIVNWTGMAPVPGGTDRLLFTGSATDFTNLFNQNEVSFDGISGYIASGDLGGFYEVTPVPEPATFVGALGVIGLIGYRERRRISNAMKWGRRDNRLTRV